MSNVKVEKNYERVIDILMDQRDEIIGEMIGEQRYRMASLYDADEVEGFWNELWRRCRETFVAGLEDKCYLTGEKAEAIIEIVKVYHDGERQYYEEIHHKLAEYFECDEEEEVFSEEWRGLLRARMEKKIRALADGK